MRRHPPPHRLLLQAPIARPRARSRLSLRPQPVPPMVLPARQYHAAASVGTSEISVAARSRTVISPEKTFMAPPWGMDGRYGSRPVVSLAASGAPQKRGTNTGRYRPRTGEHLPFGRGACAMMD